jgi:recombinational DNA repair protein (RecF pathway)
MILKGENFHINGKWGEELENYVEDLIEYTEDLDDFRLYAAQRLVDNYDQLAEDIERQVELFDHFASTLNTL